MADGDSRDGPDPGDGALGEASPLNTEADGYIYLRLTGDRFRAKGMPAESVTEVKRLSELVYEIARGIWLQRNPDRQRVPSKLTQAFDLRLVSVEDGSARPVLRLTPPPVATRLDDEDFAPVFARARDVLVHGLQAVGDREALPDEFPRNAVPALRRLGSTLEAEEALAIAPPRPASLADREPAQDDVAVVTMGTRAVLQRIDEALLAEPGPESLVGVITEFDSVRQTFQLFDDEGRTHVCRVPYDPEVTEAVKDALATSPDLVVAPDVKVEGTGLRRPDGRLGELWDVHTVQIVREPVEKDLVARLQAVAALQKGWLGRGSHAPDPEAIAFLKQMAPRIAKSGVHVAVTANADGAVVLEWRRDHLECTAELEPGGQMFLCSDNVVTDELGSYEGEADEERLVRFLQSGVL